MNMIEDEKLYWEHYWKKEVRTDNSFFAEKFLESHNLSINNYFEIGCAPGTIMAYFAKKYACKVSGVDIVNSEIIKETLFQSQVSNYEVFESDIRKFDSAHMYDFVGSYGFVEHFTKPEKIINYHKNLVAENGHLLITIPNVRKLNYLINTAFGSDFKETQNLEIMNLKLLRELILDSEFKEVEARYYLTSYFQANENSVKMDNHPVIQKVYKRMNRTMSQLNLDDIPNSCLSPYICFWQKEKVLGYNFNKKNINNY